MENQILFCFSAKSPFLTSEKVVNVHKVYELDNWPTNPNSNFTIKNYLFGAVKLSRNAIKRKFIYNGYRIGFDWGASWSFSNDFHRNGVIFGVDNSSSKHSENFKNNILTLSEGPSDDTNDSVGKLGKKFFVLSLHCSKDKSYLCVNNKELWVNNIPPYYFCLGRVSEKFTNNEMSEILSEGTLHCF